MPEIKADTANNILYLVLNGFMQPEEVEAAANKAMDEADLLQAGFCVINDIREFKPTDPASAVHIQKAQAYMSKRGVKRVYRVVGDTVLGKMQFQKAQQDAHADYEVIEVASREEAEKHIIANA